jgi:mannose-1-phosphate guanylyltransferase
MRAMPPPSQPLRPRAGAGPARYAVILAGGQGTRFWPRSRRRLPKHLLPISGRRSLLQDTVRRVLPMFSWRRLLVVTNAEHAVEVLRQLPRLPRAQVLIEPVGRNTLPCIALAAEWIAARAPEAVMAIAPADHLIKDAAGLRRTLGVACALAEQRNCLVTLGVRPNRAETGFGYIEVGSRVGRNGNAHWIRRFHEKPPAATAARYLASGRYLWNSGMFVWKASAFRQALAHYAPQVATALAGMWTACGRTTPRFLARLAAAYRHLPSVSVDVGILQPLTATATGPVRAAVVPAGFDWNDVGSWGAMPEVWGCDRTGNAAIGRLLAAEARDCIVYSPERLVALIGVDGLIVVDSPDALLVCRRERAQEVRRVAELLKQRGWSRYL